MRKGFLLIGLLVMGVALLSSCDLVDQFIDTITGGGTPGWWTPTPGAVVSGRMKFNLAATIWRDDGFTGAHSYAGNVATTFWSGAGVYSEDSRLFLAYIWDGGDFSDTRFSATLSEDEKTITSFSANQTQANAFVGYTYSNFIDGVNVPYSHINGNSRYYRIDGPAARALVRALEFQRWVPESASPGEWITGGPTALTGGSGDFIQIRLDYQSKAVAP